MDTIQTVCKVELVKETTTNDDGIPTRRRRDNDYGYGTSSLFARKVIFALISYCRGCCIRWCATWSELRWSVGSVGCWMSISPLCCGCIVMTRMTTSRAGRRKRRTSMSSWSSAWEGRTTPASPHLRFPERLDDLIHSYY